MLFGRLHAARQKGLVIEGVTRRLASQCQDRQQCLSFSPHKVPPVPSPVSPRIMSEKLKEFIDIPQQFIRDGNQVRGTHKRMN